MRVTALGLLLLGYCLSPAAGWGYLFNRFRPESNGWGYGAAGLSNPAEVSPKEQLMQTLIDEGLLEEESCSGRRCSSNDYCCSGHICVGFDPSVSGVCMATSSHQRMLECSSDGDCQDGYNCNINGECTPINDKKGFNEPCYESRECDEEKNLCCQVIRRHRQAPKKVCAYYKNPMSCFGQTDNQLPSVVKRSHKTQ